MAALKARGNTGRHASEYAILRSKRDKNSLEQEFLSNTNINNLANKNYLNSDKIGVKDTGLQTGAAAADKHKLVLPAYDKAMHTNQFTTNLTNSSHNQQQQMQDSSGQA